MIKITENCVAYLNKGGYNYLGGLPKTEYTLHLLSGRPCKVVALYPNERHEYMITLLCNEITFDMPYKFVSAIFLP